MDTFDKWFSRFLWGTDLVFLAASTPHIAAWYEHFDHASTPIEAAYAWGVGYGLAIAIDGVSVMLLYALIRIIKRGEKGWGTKAGLLLFMAFISGLSWLINWQYDLQFSSTAFSKADAVTLGAFGSQVNMGSLNPALGGAFSVLLMAYALIGKVIRPEEVKPALTDEEHKEQLKRIAQKKELQDAMRGKGLIAGLVDNVSTLADGAKEVAKKFDKTQDPTNGQPQPETPETQSRDTITEEIELLNFNSTATDKQDGKANGVPHNGDETGQKTSSQNSPLDGLTGRATVSIEDAAKIIGCEIKYVRTLRNKGKLKATARNNELLTVASIKSHMENRKKSIHQPHTGEEPIQLRAAQ